VSVVSTAQDGTVATYVVWLVRPASSINTLSRLSFYGINPTSSGSSTSPAILSPSFNPNVIAPYSTSLNAQFSAGAVVALATDPSAVIRVDAGQTGTFKLYNQTLPSQLSAGLTKFLILVTAEDGSSRQYEIDVTLNPPTGLHYLPGAWACACGNYGCGVGSLVRTNVCQGSNGATALWSQCLAAIPGSPGEQIQCQPIYTFTLQTWPYYINGGRQAGACTQCCTSPTKATC
jgi:hypothetical protein